VDLLVGHLGQAGVECAARGNQIHQPGAAVVVADIKLIGDAVAPVAKAFEGKAEHREDVPKPSGLVLADDVRRHGNLSVEDATGEKNREADARLGGGGGNVHLFAVLDGLFAGVGVNDVVHDESPFGKWASLAARPFDDYSDFSEAMRSVIRPSSGSVSICMLKPLPSACAHAAPMRVQ